MFTHQPRGYRPGTLPEPTQASRCACAHNRDGSTTKLLCAVHASADPCATVATVTGKRRHGSIIRGRCTHCGWTAGAA